MDSACDYSSTNAASAKHRISMDRVLPIAVYKRDAVVAAPVRVFGEIFNS
jgi:predicted small integral membrane protein